MRRRLGFLLMGIAALLALCACNAGSQIVVQPDGSGTFSTVMTVQGSAGEALYQSVRKAESSTKVPLTVSRYSAGGESGAKITAPFKSLNDLSALSKQLGASTGLGGVTVSKAASGWALVASSDGGLVRPPGAATGAPGGAIDGSQLAGLVSMSVSVELPGAPGKTNADSVTHTATSTRFQWNLKAGRPATDLTAATTFVGNQKSVTLATALTSLKAADSGSAAGSSGSDNSVSVSASAATSAGGNGGMIAGVGIVVAIALVAGAVLFVRSRRSRTV